ncbi:MAG: LPS export ABC transporter ATP-binding protein [Microscillaceae bacterium]
MLRAQNLFKKYKTRFVVKDVSFHVAQGEIVGLLGPNGAGKTTSFYMCVGLVKPNEGQIFLDNEEITQLPMYRRARKGLGYLAQEPSVFRKLSVEDNIRSVLEMIGLPKKDQLERTEELLEEFKLADRRKNLGRVLSGGERRRTEIARALAMKPRFLLLDEPFAGVDPLAVEDIQRIVYHLRHKNLGILITDHNADAILSITDRAYVMKEGGLFAHGTPGELVENPAVMSGYLGHNYTLNRKFRKEDVDLNS